MMIFDCIPHDVPYILMTYFIARSLYFLNPFPFSTLTTILKEVLCLFSCFIIYIHIQGNVFVGITESAFCGI